MTTMPRKAAEFWWNIPFEGRKRTERFVAPKEVSHYTQNYPSKEWTAVTWKEIHKVRTEKIQSRLFNKLRYETVKPAIVWVFNNDTFLFAGWYIYIKTVKHEFSISFRPYRPELIDKVISMFPLGVLPSSDNFDKWCEAFTRKYPTKSFGGRKKQGATTCWVRINEYGELVDIEHDLNFKL